MYNFLNSEEEARNLLGLCITNGSVDLSSYSIVAAYSSLIKYYKDCNIETFRLEYNNYIFKNFYNKNTYDVIYEKPTSIKGITEIRGRWSKIKNDGVYQEQYYPLSDSEIEELLTTGYMVFLLNYSGQDHKAICSEITSVEQLLPKYLVEIKSAVNNFHITEEDINVAIKTGKLQEGLDYIKAGDTILLNHYSVEKYSLELYNVYKKECT